VSIYLSVSLAASLRVVNGLGAVDFRVGFEFSGVVWALGFALFVLAYAPVLLRAPKTS
jgi:uncharacterized protein involved in response to NO